MTVIYDYYKDEYKGYLTEEVFNKRQQLAMLYIKKYVKQLSTIKEDDLKLCICLLVDNVDFDAILADGKAISSRSAGSVSESYIVSESAKATDSIRSIIALTLGIDCEYYCEWV